MKYTILDEFSDKKSLVINNLWPQKTAFTTTETTGEITIATNRLKITISRASNAIRYTGLNNMLITAEDENEGKIMKAATIAGIATYNCATTFLSPANEGLFGLGCHPLDTLSINYKGRDQDLAIKYLTGAIPVLLSTRGYGLLWDNYAASNFYGAEAANSKYTDGIYGGWRKDIPGKRAFFLARQAFAGQQRNAATLWSSDITCTFRAFKSQVPQGINACVSGLPYWTSDIGGYHYKWGIPDWSTPENRELFTRWFQFGTFCPVFRIHGKGERALFSKNWDDATRATLLNFDNLRYRLLPYIYSLAGRVTTENYTIMRSLAFDFRTGKTTNGGQTLSQAVPLNMLPLYVRAGSIIPMGPVMEYANEQPDAPVELRIYPGADGTFVYYEDENENYNYEKGQFATFTFNWNDQQRTLTITGRKGKYPGMPAQHTFNIVLVNEKNGTGVQASESFNKTVQYSGKMMAVKM